MPWTSLIAGCQRTSHICADPLWNVLSFIDYNLLNWIWSVKFPGRWSWKRIICRKEEGLDGKVVEDGEVSCHLSHSLMESEFLDSSLFRWNFTCKSVQIYRFRVAHWCRSLISPMRTWVQAAHGYVGSGTLVSASALYAYLFHWGITSVCSVVVVTLSLWKTNNGTRMATCQRNAIRFTRMMKSQQVDWCVLCKCLDYLLSNQYTSILYLHDCNYWNGFIWGGNGFGPHARYG